MLSEINLILGGATGAALSGVAGLLISGLTMRRARREARAIRTELAWVQHEAPELSRNLLFLELVGDEIESTPTDVAVRARFTPAELREARSELNKSGLIREREPNLLELTDAGREVLAKHQFELQESLLNRRRSQFERPVRGGHEDLDVLVEDAIASLRAKQA